MDLELIRARYGLLSLTVASYVVAFGLAQITGLKVDYAGVGRSAGYFVALMVVVGFYCHVRKLNAMTFVLETVTCTLLLIVPVLVSTYLSIRVGMPTADAVLMSWDAALGLSWRGFIAFVDARPLLAEILGLAYLSFSFQLLLIPVVLIATGRPLRAYQMAIAYAVLCYISSVISIWFPALGAYVVYGVEPEQLTSINAYFSFFFLDQFNALRTDPDFIFRMEEVAGILTFPSVHAAVAALCAWAAWDLRFARYPMMVINILMAVAAVSHASHYFVDVLAGGVVAGVSIVAVKRLTRGPNRSPVMENQALSQPRRDPFPNHDRTVCSRPDMDRPDLPL